MDLALREVRIRDAMKSFLQISITGNEYFQRNQPWVLIKNDRERCKRVIYCCANICRILAIVLLPYLPESSRQIFRMLKLEAPVWNDLTFSLPTTQIEKPVILFKKLEKAELERVKSIVTNSTDPQDYFKA